VIHFAQTHPSTRGTHTRTVEVIPERIMPIPKNDTHKNYVRYAEHCLNLVPTIKDQDVRAINREMAAEWLKLADAVLHTLKRTA
jgi:hypothetical protein